MSEPMIGQFEAFMLRTQGVSDAQVNTINRLAEQYPAVRNLELRDVMTNSNLSGVKSQVLGIMDDPALVDAFGQAMQNDPTLVTRVNALIHNDPARFGTMVDQFREHPDQLASLLQENVTEQQLAAETARAQQGQQAATDNNFLSQLQSQFGQLMEGINWESLAGILLAIVNGINGITEGIVGAVQRFAQSDEFVVDGNGGATGPLAQLAGIINPRATANQQHPDRTITSQPAASGTAPAPAADGTAPTQAAPGTDPAAPGRTPAPGMVPGQPQ